jgi:hypothetical protein
MTSDPMNRGGDDEIVDAEIVTTPTNAIVPAEPPVAGWIWNGTQWVWGYTTGLAPQPPPPPLPPPSQQTLYPQPVAYQQSYEYPVSHHVLQPVPVQIVKPPKSAGLAFVLSFLFGPLGMIYSTPIGALVMFLVNLVVIPLTFGFGLLITWPIGIIWAVIAANTRR